MTAFSIHTIDSAPAASRETMQIMKQKFGFVPNLIGELAAAPAALKAYASLSQLLEGTTLSPVERQLVLVVTSIANQCEYCVAAHSAGLRMAGFAADQLDAVRAGRPLADRKLEALRGLTFDMVNSRGRLEDRAIRSFLSAGYRPEQILEVLVGVAAKTISNYTNHIANTPLDSQLQASAWEHTMA